MGEIEYPYRGTYGREIVTGWKSIREIEGELHPIKRDPFSIPTPGSPTHYRVSVPPNTQVVYLPDPKVYPGYLSGDPFYPGDVVLYLGGVVHMDSHGVFADRNGFIRWGYHTWDFRVIPEDFV